MSDESFKDALMNLVLHLDTMELDDGTYMRVANTLRDIYNKVGNEPVLNGNYEDDGSDISIHDHAEAAIIHDNYDTFRLIYERYENIREIAIEYIMMAINHGSIECLTYLVETANINLDFTFNSQTPLEIALEIGNTHIIDYLQSRGVQ